MTVFYLNTVDASKDMKLGLFQFNPTIGIPEFMFVNLFEIGEDFIIIKYRSSYIRLESDYGIKDCLYSGDALVLMMFERDGKLYPLNFSECVPLEFRYLPFPNDLNTVGLYSDAEFCQLMDQQRKLISEILIELERQKNTAPVEQLINLVESESINMTQSKEQPVEEQNTVTSEPQTQIVSAAHQPVELDASTSSGKIRRVI